MSLPEVWDTHEIPTLTCLQLRLQPDNFSPDSQCTDRYIHSKALHHIDHIPYSVAEPNTVRKNIAVHNLPPLHSGR